MKTNVTKEQLTERLYNVLISESETKLYNSESEQRIMFGGWYGAMSPLTRPAYVADFGEKTVTECEAMARQRIKETADRYNTSNWPIWFAQADAHKADGQPAPALNTFMWTACSWLKCDGGNGIYDEIRYKTFKTEQDCIVLAYITEVINVTAEEFADGSLADTIAEARAGRSGGGWYEDDEDLNKYHGQKLFYANAIAVIAPDGRYYLIDSEGYDYARYILTPLAWRTMFAQEIAAEEARRAAEEAERERREREAAAERYRAYRAECAKWEKYCTPIAGAKEALQRAKDAVGLHWYKDKACKAAGRKLHAVKRANILNVCKAAFPGVKFTLHKIDGWGADWEISWTDGPTGTTFKNTVNLNIFCTYHDTFDGYTDCADTEREEFTEFAGKYMDGGNSIDTRREISEERGKELTEKIKKLTGATTDRLTQEQIRTILTELPEANGMSYGQLCPGVDGYLPTVVRVITDNTDYLTKETKQEQATEAPTKAIQAPQGNETPQGDTTPTEIQIIAYSEKAIAITGNTKPIKDTLKKLGGKFNLKLSCGAGWIFSKKREQELRAALAL